MREVGKRKGLRGVQLGCKGADGEKGVGGALGISSILQQLLGYDEEGKVREVGEGGGGQGEVVHGTKGNDEGKGWHGVQGGL